MAVRSEAISMAQAVSNRLATIEYWGHSAYGLKQYLWFPCGIIRGALANLGINTTVQAETSDLPGATFQIKTLQPRP
jgi:hypothetical protein